MVRSVSRRQRQRSADADDAGMARQRTEREILDPLFAGTGYGRPCRTEETGRKLGGKTATGVDENINSRLK